MTLIESMGDAVGIGAGLSGGLAVAYGVIAAIRALGPPAFSAAKHWFNGKRQLAQTNRDATRDETVAREQGAAAVLPHIMERVGALETRLDERDAKIEALEDEAAECKRGREECEERGRQQGASLVIARGDVGRLAARIEELLAEREDSTARIEVGEIRARNSTPQPFPAVTSAPDRGNGTGRHRLRTPPLAAVSSREDMKTILPPSGEE